MACIYVPCKEDPKQPDFMTLVVLFKWWTKRKENEKENRTTHEAIKIKPYVLPCN